mmetsp:Transcript_29768/g.97420  ORF Transcript_29768/g.97420 Transcript_29768/m.97420 type:complete len:166 (+) Transcript_29768:875-1372(+)
MSVHTTSRNARSWLTTTSVCGYRRSASCSHSKQSMSTKLVGSSSSSTCGFTNSAHASATRIIQPPDSCFVGVRSISSLRPSPCRIALARASAASARISANRVVTASSCDTSSSVLAVARTGSSDDVFSPSAAPPPLPAPPLPAPCVATSSADSSRRSSDISCVRS